MQLIGLITGLYFNSSSMMRKGTQIPRMHSTLFLILPNLKSLKEQAKNTLVISTHTFPVITTKNASVS